MQDSRRTSAESEALASSLVIGLDTGSVNTQPHCSPNDAGEAKTRGRKRVRRIQMELPYFRHQVRELELKLKRLKLQNASPVVGTVKRKQQSPQNLVEKGLGADQNSVWNGIAERQLKERLRVEQQQQQLKRTHGELLGLSEEMQKLLRKWGEHQQEVVTERVGAKRQQRYRYWDCKKDPAEDIYADQLSIVARLRLQMQSQSRQRPGRALSLDSGLSMGPELVKWDPSIKAGFKLKLHRGTVLPFGLEVVSEAYWRFFGFGYESEHAVQVVRDKFDLSTGTIALSFKVRADFEGFTSTVGGKLTSCRYVGEDGYGAIAWAGSTDIEDINGRKFHGLQLHKKGWVEFRRVPRQGPGDQSTSTAVEFSLESVPVFHETLLGADRAQQTQAFLDGNDMAHGKVDKFFCQVMGTMLVEEDWKATFGREAMIEA